MKKLILLLAILTCAPAFSGDVIADLQYICVRADKSKNKDVNTHRIYNASSFFRRKQAIIAEGIVLVKTSFKRITNGVVMKYDGGYENDNVLTLSFDDKRPSTLVVGARKVKLKCESY